VDTTKIAPGIYQYTAIDDCTRWLVADIYPRRTAKNSVDFLEAVQSLMLFPVQRIQTDRGTEFTAYAVQEALWYWRLKWRPIPPGMPHLNGKVERVQQTAQVEFWSETDLKSKDIEVKFLDWQIHYNRERVHGVLGMTPLERVNQLYDDGKVPDWELLDEQFDPVREYLIVRANGIDIGSFG
jgi:transposase InsO family protein